MINGNSYNLSEKYKKIIQKHHNTFPVKITEIANELGIVLSQIEMPGGVSGQIYKKDNTYHIDVNQDESHKRKRFTAAHELAHYLLHQDIIGDGVVDNALYRSVLSNDKEVEANKLAADILMPMSEIKKHTGKELPYIQQLAEHFEVSEQAMKVRLGIPF